MSGRPDGDEPVPAATSPVPGGGAAPRVPERRQETPRRVPGGLKLRLGADQDLKTEPARRWRRLLESIVPEAVMSEGWSYASAGQVASLELATGEVRATVQGRAGRPYRTQISLAPIDEAGWSGLIEALADEAVHLARLLAGEMPAGLPDLFAAGGLPLVPEPEPGRTPGPDPGLRCRCTCADPDPCKHAAAVGLLVAERLDVQPLKALALRGLPLERLLDRLHQVRVMRSRGVAAAHADPMIPESTREPRPLEACMEEFWRPGAAPEPDAEVDPEYVPHALLRRLGPSPLRGKFPLAGLLASIYDSVSESVGRLRDEAEQVEDEEEKAESSS